MLSTAHTCCFLTITRVFTFFIIFFVLPAMEINYGKHALFCSTCTQHDIHSPKSKSWRHFSQSHPLKAKQHRHASVICQCCRKKSAMLINFIVEELGVRNVLVIMFSSLLMKNFNAKVCLVLLMTIGGCRLGKLCDNKIYFIPKKLACLQNTIEQNRIWANKGQTHHTIFFVFN